MELKNLKKKDSEIAVKTLTFSMEEYEKIKNVNRLSKTIQNILHFINEFGKKLNLKEEVRIHFVNDQPQKRDQDLWSFSTLFFVNLFNPDEKS